MTVVHSPEFLNALLALTAEAKAKTDPAQWSRLQAGALLVLDGAIVQHFDQAGAPSQECTVQSSADPRVRYTVCGSVCQCQDYQFRKRACKHVYASWIYRRARQASLPKDWQSGYYSEGIKDLRAEAGDMTARVCHWKYGQQRNGGEFCVTAGK